MRLADSEAFVIERAYHETRLAYRIEQTAVMQLEGMRSRFVHPEILAAGELALAECENETLQAAVSMYEKIHDIQSWSE